MFSILSLPVLLVGLVVGASAQEAPSYLCNKTSADANGTFFYSFNPHVDQGPEPGQENHSGQTLDVGVGLTLSQNFETDKVEYSLWYDTNGANYKNDTELGYDVCAISWSPTPGSTQIRGQSDNGTCYNMFSEACITAIESDAEKYAIQFYQTVTGQANSSGSVASPPSLICGDIATQLNANLPQACSSFVNSSTSFAPSIPITGASSPVYAFNCPMTGQLNGTESTYQLFQTKTANYSKEAYAGYADYAWPLLAVWMPYSGSSPYTIQNASAGMICGRIDNYTENSYHPAPLMSPSPTASPTPSTSPSPSNNGLSGGAIAGIVVGVVVGVALIVGILAWFLLKRRKSKKAANQIFEKDSEDTLHEAATNSPSTLTNVKTVGSLSEAPDTAISELPPDGDATWAKRQELNADKEHEVFELPSEIHGIERGASFELPTEGRERGNSFELPHVQRVSSFELPAEMRGRERGSSVVSSISADMSDDSTVVSGEGRRRLSDVEE